MTTTDRATGPHASVLVDVTAVRDAVRQELAALAGRVGIDTDQGTWATLRPDERPDHGSSSAA